MSDDKIEERIRKLLRLAQDNSNVNEAAVAFARAQDLATRHMLDLDSLSNEPQDEEPSLREVSPIERRRIETWDKAVPWKLNVASAVASANACRVFYYPGRGGGITAYGQPLDLETTAIVYSMIEMQIERLAKEAVASYRDELAEVYGSVREGVSDGEETPRTYGRSFRLGAAHTIGRRLASATKAVAKARALAEASADVRALVRVDAAAAYLARVESSLDRFKDSLGLKNGSGFTGPRSESGYAAGRRAGEGVAVTRRKEIGS